MGALLHRIAHASARSFLPRSHAFDREAGTSAPPSLCANARGCRERAFDAAVPLLTEASDTAHVHAVFQDYAHSGCGEENCLPPSHVRRHVTVFYFAPSLRSLPTGQMPNTEGFRGAGKTAEVDLLGSFVRLSQCGGSPMFST